MKHVVKQGYGEGIYLRRLFTSILVICPICGIGTQEDTRLQGKKAFTFR